MAPKRTRRIPDPPDIGDPSTFVTISSYVSKVDDEFSHTVFNELDFARKQSLWVDVRESIYRKCNFTDSDFNYFRAADILVEDSDLANADWGKISADRIAFIRCRMVGFKGIEAALRNVKFEGCLMTYSQLRFASLAGAWFENCQLHNADFSGSDLTGATFHQCDLSGVAFS